MTQQMVKYTMFIDQKNQYNENEYATQSNLQIQFNTYQATNGIFHRVRTDNFTICMEIQMPPLQEDLQKVYSDIYKFLTFRT